MSLVSNDTGKDSGICESGASLPTGRSTKSLSPQERSKRAPRTIFSSLSPIPVRYGSAMVSLFPPTYKNRENGNRPDLMEKMHAMNPQFLRLPGGNYLEGDEIQDRFDWKTTIGPLVDRPTHPSPWRVSILRWHGPFGVSGVDGEISTSNSCSGGVCRLFPEEARTSIPVLSCSPSCRMLLTKLSS